MRKFVVRSLLIAFALVSAGLGGGIIGVVMKPPSKVYPPLNACEGGAICENWMELLRNNGPTPEVVRSRKAPKLKVRPSRRPQFG